jgi:hypothetical protein
LVFALKEALAIPLEFVVTVIVLLLLLKIPLAPAAGAVNVTVEPEMAMPAASLIVTASGLVNAVEIGVA